MQFSSTEYGEYFLRSEQSLVIADSLQELSSEVKTSCREDKIEKGRKKTAFVRIENAQIVNPTNPALPADMIICVIDAQPSYTLKYRDLRRVPMKEQMKFSFATLLGAATLGTYYAFGADGIMAKTMTSAASGVVISTLVSAPIDLKILGLALPTSIALAFQITTGGTVAHYVFILGCSMVVVEVRRHAKQWQKNGKAWGNTHPALPAYVTKVREWAKTHLTKDKILEGASSAASKVSSVAKYCFKKFSSVLGCGRVDPALLAEEGIEEEEEMEELASAVLLEESAKLIAEIPLRALTPLADDEPITQMVYLKDGNLTMVLKIGAKHVPVISIDEGDDDDDDDDQLEKDSVILKGTEWRQNLFKVMLVASSIGTTMLSSYAFGEGNTTAIAAGFSAGLLKMLGRKQPFVEKYLGSLALMIGGYRVDMAKILPMPIGFLGGKIIASSLVKDLKDLFTGKEPKNRFMTSKMLGKVLARVQQKLIDSGWMKKDDAPIDDDNFFAALGSKKNRGKFTLSIPCREINPEIESDETICLVVRYVNGVFCGYAKLPKGLKHEVEVPVKNGKASTLKTAAFYSVTLGLSVATSVATQSQSTWNVVYPDPFHVQSEKQGEGTLNNIVSTPLNAGYKQTARNIHWTMSVAGAAGIACLATALEAYLMTQGKLPFRFSYIFQGPTLGVVQKWGKNVIDDKQYFTKHAEISCQQKQLVEELV